MWFRENKLTLNVDKSKFIVYTTPHSKHKYEGLDMEMGGNRLERVEQYKYLGLHLDECLTFTTHVDYLYQMTTYKLRMIGRVRDYINTETLLTLYKSLILPIYDYCDVCYGSFNVENKHRMQRLPNSAERVITRMGMYTPTLDMHIALGLELLDTRRNMHTTTQVYQGIHDINTPFINELLDVVGNPDGRVTRQWTNCNVKNTEFLTRLRRAQIPS